MVFDVQKNLQDSRVPIHAAPNSSILTSYINTGHLLQFMNQYNIDTWLLTEIYTLLRILSFCFRIPWRAFVLHYIVTSPRGISAGLGQFLKFTLLLVTFTVWRFWSTVSCRTFPNWDLSDICVQVWVSRRKIKGWLVSFSPHVLGTILLSATCLTASGSDFGYLGGRA